MTKRKVTFEGNSNIEDDGHPESKSRRFKENHSLDSDEEEEKIVTSDSKKPSDETDVLDDEDIEGQEDETIREDDGIKVTPFNLKEEMEEGHFDGQGNYIPNKQGEQITDDWLDSVDWNKLPSKKPAEKNKQQDETSKVDNVNPVELKKQMVTIMKPGENVLRALRRLGGNKKPLSTADRWKKKKADKAGGGGETLSEKEKEAKEMLLKLTGFADDLMGQGDFQVYEKTFEKLNFEIKEKQGKFKDAVKEDEDDDDDLLEAAFKGESALKESKVDKMEVDDGAGSSKVDVSTEVMWFYKDKLDVSDDELKGPFSSTQMLKWQDAGRFGDGGVYCRKQNQDGANFFHSKRIDFDLYTS